MLYITPLAADKKLQVSLEGLKFLNFQAPRETLARFLFLKIKGQGSQIQGLGDRGLGSLGELATNTQTRSFYNGCATLTS